MRALIALALACFVFGAAATSETPAPTRADAASQEKRNAGKHQQQAEADKRGTTALPLVIDLNQTPVIKVETTDKTEHHHDYSSGEWWLVYLTGALVLVTGGLALYTAKLYRATVKLGSDANQNASDALSIARQQSSIAVVQSDVLEKQKEIQRLQFFAAHRPLVIVRRIRLGYKEGVVDTIDYELYNAGATDCFVEGRSAGAWIEADARGRPKPSDYAPMESVSIPLKAGEASEQSAVLPRGSGKDSAVSIAFRLATAPRLLDSDAVRFIGTIRYSGLTERVYETSFLRSYDRASDRFVAIDDADYEYQY